MEHLATPLKNRGKILDPCMINDKENNQIAHYSYINDILKDSMRIPINNNYKLTIETWNQNNAESTWTVIELQEK